MNVAPEGMDSERSGEPLWLRPGVRLCALVAVTLSVIVALGFVFDLPRLRSVLPGAVEMKANTALCLLLSGLALWPARARRAGYAQWLAACVAGVGAITLLEYAFVWNAGIDELLIRDPGGPFTAYPGRMSPYSAVAFCCLGAAQWLQTTRQARPLVLLGACVAGLIGLVSVLGYALGAHEITTDQWVPPLAIHTAVAFVLLACGVLLNARPVLVMAAFDESPLRTRAESQVLVGRIAAELRRAREEAGEADEEACVCASAVSLDVAILQELVGTDPERLRELLGIFAGTASETARSLGAAVRAGHCEDATAAAHKIKSSARMAGALPLGDLCEAMESAGREGRLDELGGLLPRFEAEMEAVLRAIGAANAPPTSRADPPRAAGFR
jgi:HPt (histidine-containing phosphotransfer) domain-containing protein